MNSVVAGAVTPAARVTRACRAGTTDAGYNSCRFSLSICAMSRRILQAGHILANEFQCDCLIHCCSA
jgi:hypothetical protein